MQNRIDDFTQRPDRLLRDQIPTPLGTILLVTDEAGTLRALDFDDCEHRMLRLLRLHYGSTPLHGGAAPADVTGNLQRYFGGEPAALRSVAWATAGTPFQRAVWNALVGIRTVRRALRGLARQLGLPGAARAVGWANGSNPVGIVVPCHRVIGASGKLTGYAGGLHRKQWLLAHESAGLCLKQLVRSHARGVIEDRAGHDQFVRAGLSTKASSCSRTVAGEPTNEQPRKPSTCCCT